MMQQLVNQHLTTARMIQIRPDPDDPLTDVRVPVDPVVSQQHVRRLVRHDPDRVRT
jgi:hypothetical protein